MPLVEDEHMVETLTSNRADHPFDQWILPRGHDQGPRSPFPRPVPKLGPFEIDHKSAA